MGKSTKNVKPKINRTETVCPEETVNIFSYLSFSWLDPIFKDGYSRPLEEKDLWKLPLRLQTQLLCDEFEKHWSMEVKNATTTSQPPSIYRAIHSFMFWKLAPAG